MAPWSCEAERCQAKHIYKREAGAIERKQRMTRVRLINSAGRVCINRRGCVLWPLALLPPFDIRSSFFLPFATPGQPNSLPGFFLVEIPSIRDSGPPMWCCVFPSHWP